MTRLPMGSAIPYDKDLNASQLEAVTYTRGPLLVIAGAGSGKTRTLTYRVARLVESGTSPDAVLLLTFTRKAADEMLRRASKLLDRRCDRVSGGTFHSFANAVLRRYASRLELDPGFLVLDRPDTESLIGMLRKEMGFASLHRSFPRKQTLANIFSKAVNKTTSVEAIVLDDYSHLAEHLEAILTLHAEYHRRKAAHSFLDFDDLLTDLRRLLEEDTYVRERLMDRYRFVMVDEYQDTNRIQADIIHHLVGPERNVMVVGDDSQSIYAFRGADYRNILDFPERFPGTKVVRLEENYRSIQPILDLANRIIDRAREKYTKTLYTRHQGGDLPQLVTAADENSQSRFVVDRIQALQGEGISLDRICVLFRASYHSFDLEIELGKREIPFVKVGGFKFMDAAHIKDVLAHLRLLLNPYDRLSWYRALLLLENIGPATAQKIYEQFYAMGRGSRGISDIRPPKGITAQVDRLKDLYSRIDPQSMTVAKLGELVLDYYLPLLRDRYDDHPKRARDLEQLVVIMARYGSLERFITDMTLEPPDVRIDDTFIVDPDETERLTLSTIHSAKGLEWDAVFIIWALDGRFPSIHALDKEEELEEELRLMYVAATRARRNLFITYPMSIYDRSLGMALNRPCRFIDGISEDVLDKQFVGTTYQPGGRYFDFGD